ncbi:hypothetical protein PCE1_002166 [Barthelona sp. PCE]
MEKEQIWDRLMQQDGYPSPKYVNPEQYKNLPPKQPFRAFAQFKSSGPGLQIIGASSAESTEWDANLDITQLTSIFNEDDLVEVLGMKGEDGKLHVLASIFIGDPQKGAAIDPEVYKFTADIMHSMSEIF